MLGRERCLNVQKLELVLKNVLKARMLYITTASAEKPRRRTLAEGYLKINEGRSNRRK